MKELKDLQKDRFIDRKLCRSNFIYLKGRQLVGHKTCVYVFFISELCRTLLSIFCYRTSFFFSPI